MTVSGNLIRIYSSFSVKEGTCLLSLKCVKCVSSDYSFDVGVGDNCEITLNNIARGTTIPDSCHFFFYNSVF